MNLKLIMCLVGPNEPNTYFNAPNEIRVVGCSMYEETKFLFGCNPFCDSVHTILVRRRNGDYSSSDDVRTFRFCIDKSRPIDGDSFQYQASQGQVSVSPAIQRSSARRPASGIVSAVFDRSSQGPIRTHYSSGSTTRTSCARTRGGSQPTVAQRGRLRCLQGRYIARHRTVPPRSSFG
jgi:hypothetical protein